MVRLFPNLSLTGQPISSNCKRAIYARRVFCGYITYTGLTSKLERRSYRDWNGDSIAESTILMVNSWLLESADGTQETVLDSDFRGFRDHVALIVARACDFRRRLRDAVLWLDPDDGGL